MVIYLPLSTPYNVTCSLTTYLPGLLPTLNNLYNFLTYLLNYIPMAYLPSYTGLPKHITYQHNCLPITNLEPKLLVKLKQSCKIVGNKVTIKS